MVNVQIKKKCEKCLEYFPEYELDLDDGKWLCINCEEEAG